MNLRLLQVLVVNPSEPSNFHDPKGVPPKDVPPNQKNMPDSRVQMGKPPNNRIYDSVSLTSRSTQSMVELVEGL